MGTRTVFGSSIACDNSEILISDDRTGILNAYAVPVDEGEPRQLTCSTVESVIVRSWFPEDKRALVEYDSGGDEKAHIYLLDIDGTQTDLTPFEGARNHFYGWRFDGKGFYFGSNKRNPKFTDVYEMDVERFEPHMIFQNDEGFIYNGMSRNRRYMAFTKPVGANKSDFYLYDRWKKSMKKINDDEGDVLTSPSSFGVDSAYLYYRTNKGSEYMYLCRYQIATGKHEVVEKSDCAVTGMYFSRNGTYQIVVYDDDAQTRIEVRERRTQKVVPVGGMAMGQVTSISISRDETYISFYLSGAKIPPSLHVLNLKTGTIRKRVDPIHKDINPEHLVESTVVRYKSFDGLEIPAILYVPHGATSDNKVPGIVWVHGGPGGQSRLGYSSLLQYFANNGYVVLAVNNRGSSGYGKTFYKLDDKKHGEDDLDDCIYGRDYLISTGIVDKDSIAIAGGSYGGTMTLAALTFRPEAFAAGVDIFGPSNWLRTLKQIPPWWEAQKKALFEEMGDPNTDEEYLKRISPLFHAKNIVRPLMVLQGVNDPRVLQVESDEIVAAARANGVPVEYIVFDDEGHGFRKKKNQLSGYKAIVDFLNEYVAQ